MYDFKLATIIADKKVPEDALLMDPVMADQYGISGSQSFNLCTGRHCRRMVPRMGSVKEQNKVYMHPLTIKKMYLQAGTRYGIQKKEDGLHLGPVVGIMHQIQGSSGERPYGDQTLFMKQLIEAGKSIGEICFCFCPYSIDWNRQIIAGYTHGPQGWVKAIFPFPDVIYPRSKGSSASRAGVRSRMEKLGVKFFNSILGGGKWQEHKIISLDSELAPYLPETRLIRSFREIDEMLKKYQAVYLKPVDGSQGKNIIKVVKRQKSPDYEYQYQIDQKQIKGKVYSLDLLYRRLRPVMNGRTYIVQRQINLIKSEGRIIDVRILVQKDHKDRWSTTGMACRMGGNGGITSNISSGGAGYKVESILKSYFGDDNNVRKIIAMIEKLALKSAAALERSIGKCGEMGIDIGIDNEGRVWFIEANLRPARKVFNLIGEREMRRQSVEKPMLYCRYLAGFTDAGV